MRAIVDINGKQYEVEEGRYVTIDRYEADENAEVVLNNVRLVVAGGHSLIGSPFVDGATVKTHVKRHGRGPKVLVYKMRCKKGYRRKNGHRQDFTELMVDLLEFPGKDGIPAEFKTAPAPAAPKRVPKAATVEAPAEVEKPAKTKKDATGTTTAKPKTKKAAEDQPTGEATEVKAPKKKAPKQEEASAAAAHEAVETVTAETVEATSAPEATEAPVAEAPAETAAEETTPPTEATAPAAEEAATGDAPKDEVE
jgi:large subunit ribosomal protein L21